MYCGHENEDSAENCVMCGNRLLDVSADETAPLEEIPDDDSLGDDDIPDVTPDISLPLDDGSSETAGSDVGRGETVAAQQQLGETGAAEEFGGQDYGYEAQAGGQQEYGGQAYGYDETRDADREEDYDEEDGDYYGGGQLQTKSRKMVKSILFFLPVLAYTASFAAYILFVVLGNARVNLTTFANTVTYRFGSNMITDAINYGVKWVMGQNEWIVNGVMLAAAVPMIFIMLGLWMAFFNTSSRREYNSTAGLTMVRVIEILKFIVSCLLLTGLIALAVVYVVTAAAAAETMSLIVGVIALLAAILFAVLAIMYYLQLIFSIKLVRENVRSGNDIGYIPGFLIFVGIICCAFTVLLMLPMAPDDYIGLAYRGATAAWFLLISLWAVIYRVVVKVK